MQVEVVEMVFSLPLLHKERTKCFCAAVLVAAQSRRGGGAKLYVIGCCEVAHGLPRERVPLHEPRIERGCVSHQRVFKS